MKWERREEKKTLSLKIQTCSSPYLMCALRSYGDEEKKKETDKTKCVCVCDGVALSP